MRSDRNKRLDARSTRWRHGALLAWTIALGLAPWSLTVAACDGGFDHEYRSYAALLETYVRDGLVNYQALSGDSASLNSAVREFSELSAAEFAIFDSSQRMALWINAYNLFTIASIIERYPVASIKDIRGVWNKRTWSCAGRELTLDQIEHDILRKEFSEPRVHVALVCASISCPELYNQPFRASALDEQLTDRARAFARDTTRNRIDIAKRTIWLSKILDWYGSDFQSKYPRVEPFEYLSKKDAAAVGFIHAHLPDSLQAPLVSERFRVKHLGYDWGLNEFLSKADSAAARE